MEGSALYVITELLASEHYNYESILGYQPTQVSQNLATSFVCTLLMDGCRG